MFIGHFGIALAAKKVHPKTSLGMLFIGAQFIDLLWPLLLLTGVEHVRIDPGNTVVTPLDFYDYPISHSLLMTILWGAILGGIFYLKFKDVKQFFVIALCVTSHWFLDWLTHRPDLPLVPGSSNYHGLGLWNSLPGTMIIEFGIFALGLWLYLQTTNASNRTGHWALWSLIVFLIAVWLGNFFGSPPPNAEAIAIVGNATWLLVLWGYWADRNRSVISSVL
ncbi:hypothetical protein HUU42_04690 [bacterium]|nr:hypothetical protein [bacterium]